MPKEDLAAQMEILVGQYRESGQTRKAFAASHGISQAKLIYWIKKLSKGGAKKVRSSSNFVPLKVSSAALGSRDHLLIRLRSGVEIQIPL